MIDSITVWMFNFVTSWRNIDQKEREEDDNENVNGRDCEDRKRNEKRENFMCVCVLI